MFQMDTVNNTKYVLTVINLNNSTRYYDIKDKLNLLHGIVYSSFTSKETKKLFQLTYNKTNKSLELRILSEEKPNKYHLSKEFGVSTKSIHHYDYSTRMDNMSKGSVYKFHLIGNPVKRKFVNSKCGSLIPLNTDEECIDWLSSRAQQKGFDIKDLKISKQKPKVGKNNIMIHTVEYTGTLEVTDEEAFKNTIIDGIGHERAYGYGMLWVEEI